MNKKACVRVSLILVSALLIIGCRGQKAEPAVVKKGDTVKVNYTGRLDDGTVFDSSQGRAPLQFTVGTGSVIQGFDEGVLGMKTGESRTVKILVDKAYGPYRQDLVLRVPLDQFPAGTKPQVGQQYQVANGNQAMVVKVIAVSDKEVTLDGNHPLAGKNLTFDITVVEIQPSKS